MAGFSYIYLAERTAQVDSIQSVESLQIVSLVLMGSMLVFILTRQTMKTLASRRIAYDDFFISLATVSPFTLMRRSG